MAGMTAGVAGAIVSQPADTVLTRLNTVKKSPAPPPKLAPSTAARQPWYLRPSMAGAVGVRLNNLGGRFGGGDVGLLEEEVQMVEDIETTPDWKDIVKDMFEGEGGVANLFRSAKGKGGRGVWNYCPV